MGRSYPLKPVGDAYTCISPDGWCGTRHLSREAAERHRRRMSGKHGGTWMVISSVEHVIQSCV